MENSRSMDVSRRKFLHFLGRGAVLSAIAPSALLSACTPGARSSSLTRSSLSPTTVDDLQLADGLQAQVLVSRGDVINPDKGWRFGDNNDFIVYLPDAQDERKGLLWVNHEALTPFLISGYDRSGPKTKAQIEKEMPVVGGAILRIEQQQDGTWKVDKSDARNRRLDGWTPIPFANNEQVAGSRVATGTMGNCAGGVTPWGHILTCEENTADYYGSVVFDEMGGRTIDHEGAFYQWYRHTQRPPEHYGWVVEVDPQSGEAWKHTSMGRFAHECATVKELPDKRCVVYTGDDEEDEHLYKFIGDTPGRLHTGKLYVANIEKGQWVSLMMEDQPILQAHFKDQLEVMVRCREAAKLVGATPLDRPEDIEIDPGTGAVLVSLTNNKPKGNYHGAIMRLVEQDNDYEALTFSAETMLAGGEETGFSCPDNMAFDPKGNLWLTCDISGSAIGEAPYTAFGNNGLYYIPMSGPEAGKVVQVASAPNNAELTGPWFAPDGKSLFLSVQHPGEQTKSMEEITSHWPEGGDALPKSSVVVISGPALDALMA